MVQPALCARARRAGGTFLIAARTAANAGTTDMNKYATQGRCIIAELRARPLTYRQMLNLGAGNSPWKLC